MTYCEGVKARTKREILSVVVLMEVEVTTHTEAAERTGRSCINQLGCDIKHGFDFYMFLSYWILHWTLFDFIVQ